MFYTYINNVICSRPWYTVFQFLNVFFLILKTTSLRSCSFKTYLASQQDVDRLMSMPLALDDLRSILREAPAGFGLHGHHDGGIYFEGWIHIEDHCCCSEVHQSEWQFSWWDITVDLPSVVYHSVSILQDFFSAYPKELFVLSRSMAENVQQSYQNEEIVQGHC